jgi:hypothetical protein
VLRRVRVTHGVDGLDHAAAVIYAAKDGVLAQAADVDTNEAAQVHCGDKVDYILDI